MANNSRIENKAFISIMAAGAGVASLGLLTAATEASPAIKSFLNIYNPVGPLSGKTTYAVVVYLVSWYILSIIFSKKDLQVDKVLKITFGLIAIGIALTFPPIFKAFGP